MANLGRAYPRAFRRDFSVRRDPLFLDYLPRRMRAILSGPAVGAAGFPTTRIISQEGFQVSGGDHFRYLWPYSGGVYPGAYLQADWILTHTVTWWRAEWLFFLTPTLYWTNNQTTYVTVPYNIPRVLSSTWVDRFGNPTFQVSLTEQAVGLWSDEP